jgi:hypothetical protein
VTPRLLINFYKYMRKIRAKGIEELERRILILSLLYIISFVICFFFSNGVMDRWKLWENERVFLKKNMEFQVT